MPPSSPPRSRTKTFFFVGALSILGTVTLLLAAELLVRVRFAFLHKDPAYLVKGILDVKGRGPVRIDTGSGATRWNSCAERDIYYRVNSAGGRGPEWAQTKPTGSIRILAIGESSTYGSANAEDHTWPALLRNALAARGITAEILNFGVVGTRIERMIKMLPSVLDKYHPDVIVHYAGFNETWTDATAPQLLGFLSYRSMLYTYIYERMFFLAAASAERSALDTRTYETNFTKLVRIARDRGARVVVTQQAVAVGATPREGTDCAASWSDEETLKDCLGRLLAQPDSRYSRLVRIRMFKTVVLQRVLADVAAREDVLVLDPRHAVVEGLNGRRLYCDEIHLTDEGNAALVGGIAGPLADYLKQQYPDGPR